MTDLGYDCLIIGGGTVGLLAAVTLAADGFRLAIIDHGALDPDHGPGAGAASQSLALSATTIRLLRQIDLWDAVVNEACPIDAMRVRDSTPSVLDDKSRPNAMLDFGAIAKTPENRRKSSDKYHADVTSDAPPGMALGAVIESRFLARGLLQRAAADEHISLIGHHGARLGPVQAGAMRSVSLVIPASDQTVSASDQTIPAPAAGAADALRHPLSLRAPLILAADGAGSPSRAAAGLKTIRRSYRQTAISASLVHPVPHHNTAWQDFLPEGPCALLPLNDEPLPRAMHGEAPSAGRQARRHRSALVWTVDTNTAAALMRLSSSDFCAALSRFSSRDLGGFELAGPRWSQPLNIIHAQSAIAPRLALLGDAAHQIHPLAGQGFNLAVRDITLLRDIMIKARYAGEDIGAEATLARYDRGRRGDVVGMSLLTHGLNGLFGISDRSSPPLFAGPATGLRRAGLSLFNRIDPLKALAMRVAAG